MSKPRKKPETVNRISNVEIPPSTHTKLLSKPPPWKRSWLEANGLKVVYFHGKAKLEFKE